MKYEKREVEYEHPARGMNHCGQCRFFREPHRCQKVQGYIEKGDWCKLWKPKPK